MIIRLLEDDELHLVENCFSDHGEYLPEGIIPKIRVGAFDGKKYLAGVLGFMDNSRAIIHYNFFHTNIDVGVVKRGKAVKMLVDFLPQLTAALEYDLMIVEVPDSMKPLMKREKFIENHSVTPFWKIVERPKLINSTIMSEQLKLDLEEELCQRQ